jgi:hypothetical protein
MDESTLVRWVDDPGSIEPGRRPADPPGLRERKQARFAKFCALPESDLITDVLWHYMRNVPRYAASERSQWALSCMADVPAGRLAVVSMRTMEVIVMGRSAGFLIVSEDAVMRRFGGWDAFSRQHPELEPRESNYKDPGDDQVRLSGCLSAMHGAVTDERIGYVIRALTARVFRLGRTMHHRGHCPQLADLVLDEIGPLNTAARHRARHG